ncbi:hypothetical protein, partial [Vibrio parahaemolyticus]|uniref:hypothetical protein n=1 Tax=Vibrio parahaemolyticus TaxID=670 RepID=UPI003081165F
ELMRIKQSNKPQEKESLTQGISSKTHPAYNALLRCEQCNTEASAYHLNHLNQRIVKMPRVANHS